MNKRQTLEALNRIPVIVNDCYGDPLYPLQFSNTLSKLKSLYGREGATVVVTKGIVSKKEICQMEPFISQNVVFVYSLTGLNEGNISFKKRKDTICRLSKICDKIVPIIRPIIIGRNDKMSVLKSIIDVVANYSSVLVYGGYKENGAERYNKISESLETQIINYARDKELQVFRKSACAVAHLLNHPCSAHRDNCLPSTTGLEILKSLGYNCVLKDSKIFISSGTIGDCNFIRFITGSQPIIRNIDRRSNILSFSTDKKIYEAILKDINNRTSYL